ncbi:MAG: Crp/Fnr family transcriptional regulator [Peptoniphilus sp.]|uniref:Crp/Fnr family transcriptional regulator n=1 Tax=Peptoniphilus sp. TaxID=1971214 RepID=UPI0025CEC6C9|nr:Crp/Fnr family transcriptional regulator [Peptoniphilus sp.]MCI5643659.1 Crp/Fnr family transcriptional regulator [Peptoniphilus sp.]MDD7353464.1 Crp/Fnr family transcriptional regulator [Peptoniphilaceae bacterium]
MELSNILTSLQLFYNLDERELDEVKNYLSDIKVYKNKSTVFNVGDYINYFGILLNGQVELEMDDVFGNKTILSKLSAPALFAESILIKNVGEIPLSVVTTMDTEIIFFDYNSFSSENLKSKEKVKDNLIKILAGKNLFMRDKLNLLTLPTSRAKILYFLSTEARKSHSKYFTIDFNITELAQFLNLNRSSLSRELSKLKKEGLIDYHNKTFRIL